jgi:membrane protein implicated in regulation of membrane protease activity
MMSSLQSLPRRAEVIVAVLAIACLAAGGYTIWFGLGPAAESHGGMPFLAWGIVLGGLGFILAVFASRLSRSAMDQDRGPRT